MTGGWRQPDWLEYPWAEECDDQFPAEEPRSNECTVSFPHRKGRVIYKMPRAEAWNRQPGVVAWCWAAFKWEDHCVLKEPPGELEDKEVEQCLGTCFKVQQKGAVIRTSVRRQGSNTAGDPLWVPSRVSAETHSRPLLWKRQSLISAIAVDSWGL
jgi:hypothetical protein